MVLVCVCLIYKEEKNEREAIIYIYICVFEVVFAAFHGKDGPICGEDGGVDGGSAGGGADDIVVLQRSSS